MIPISKLTIYNASAGSGKTYTLVKVYLTLVLQTEDPLFFSKILAVTFTNKAANEMKERIISSLHAMAYTDLESWESPMYHELSSTLKISCTELQRRAKNVLTALLHHYSKLSISTLDKFTLRLIRNFTQDFGIASNFEVEMDVDQLLQEAVDLLMGDLGENKALTQAIVEYALTRLDEDKTWDVSQSLLEMAKLLYKEGDRNYLEELTTHELASFNDLQKHLTNIQHLVETQLKKWAREALMLVDQEQIARESFASGARNGIVAYFEKFERGDFCQPTATHTKIIEEEKIAAQKASSAEIERIERIFPELKRIFLEMYSFYDKEEESYWINKSIIKNICSLSVISEVEKNLEKIKEETNKLLSVQFNQMISDEIKEQPVPYIYERIGEQYKHYFIDEFQDTSLLQWANLKPLIHNQLSQNGSAMLVGDVKQSIYRWRGGEPEQFIKVSNTGDGLAFETHVLDKNYRSRQQIVAFNNCLYNYAADTFEDVHYREIYHQAAQEANTKEGGFVEIVLLEKGRSNRETYEEVQLEYVLQTLRDLEKEKILFGNVAILVVKNKQGTQLAEYLMHHQIPVMSKESLLLKNSNEVAIIIQVLYVLVAENDYLSRFNLLRFLIETERFRGLGDVHQFIETSVKCSLSDFFAVLKAYDVIFHPEEALQHSLYDTVEYIVRTFHLSQIGKNTYIAHFLDFVLQYMQKRGNNLKEFLIYWEEQKESKSISIAQQDNAVQIMTIHKAKGLQFPIVILPFVDWDAFNRRGSNLWIPLEKEDYQGFSNFYIPIESKLQSFDRIKPQIEIYKNQAQLDQLNILYVATTRAEERLYIATIKASTEEKKGSIAYYINDFLNKSTEKVDREGKFQLGKRESLLGEIQAAPSLHPIQYASYDWKSSLAIRRTADLYWNEIQQTAANFGNMLHALLAEVHYSHQVDEKLQNALEAGLISQEERQIIRVYIARVIENEVIAPFFKQAYTVYNEQEILYQRDILRLDRLVVKDRLATVIDYKTGVVKPTHQQQMKRYVAAVRSIGFDCFEAYLVYITEDGIEVKSVES